MPIIPLRFSPDMERAVTTGKKCSTVRTERKGDVGDVFIIQGRMYRICHVHRAALQSFRDGYYNADGFSSPAEFQEFWETHVGPFNPVQCCYIHLFAYMGDDSCQ